MALTEFAKNNMLDHLVTEDLYVSVHEGNPETDLVEVQKAARIVATYNNPASNGIVISTTNTKLAIPSNTTVGFVGVWDAVTGGNLVATYALDSPETFNNAGNLILQKVKLSLV